MSDPPEFTERRAERFLKSFSFSLILFAVWGGLTFFQARGLLRRFAWIELLWVIYNATLAILFLIRSRPSIVSTNPVHWLVALTASFGGFLFRRNPAAPQNSLISAADALIVAGVIVSGLCALRLGRSYDFAPALRQVQTDWFYRIVRHPMYVASLIIRGGYLAKNPSLWNLAAFALLVVLYDLRAKFEESILVHDEAYRAYTARVRYRFLPGLY